MPSPGPRRSRNYNAGNTPRNQNNHVRSSRSSRSGKNPMRGGGGGGINARRRSTFHGYRYNNNDFKDPCAEAGKNIEWIVGIVYLIIILIIVGWLQFACDWYTARCSHFVQRAEATNITLPEGWNKFDYKGCDKNVSTSVNASDDTLIYFGLNRFTHLNSDGNYVYFIFSLAEKANYFWSFSPLLWLLFVLNIFGIIMAVVYYSMKNMSMSMMYTSKGMRFMFGPGNGVFAALGFAISMVMYMDYRHGVKGEGKTHILVLDSLDYGGNFNKFMVVIVLYALAIAGSIALFKPDEEKLSKGKEARKSFKMAVRKVSTVNRVSRSNNSSPRRPSRMNHNGRSSRSFR